MRVAIELKWVQAGSGYGDGAGWSEGWDSWGSSADYSAGHSDGDGWGAGWGYGGGWGDGWGEDDGDGKSCHPDSDNTHTLLMVMRRQAKIIRMLPWRLADGRGDGLCYDYGMGWGTTWGDGWGDGAGTGAGGGNDQNDQNDQGDGESRPPYGEVYEEVL